MIDVNQYNQIIGTIDEAKEQVIEKLCELIDWDKDRFIYVPFEGVWNVEKEPEKTGWYLVTFQRNKETKPKVMLAYYWRKSKEISKWFFDFDLENIIPEKMVTAWMERPVPYRKEAWEEEEDD